MTQKKREKKPPVEHKDRLGKIINVGDFVAYPVSNSLQLGCVIKLNNKMIKVSKVPKPARGWGSEFNKYATDTVKLDEKEMTFYLLKHSG